ncbi:DUF3575 domain-containing protein [Dysgonomonas sp. GY75]|uniref:DUF3575 domain-containing protein n=1 Tax=Dysgonomonas sp. GY75 TaxID=2780419 RepID=UPI001F5593CF|nr:DUF3575 domain-containing protein [Dysgonomonas sp. GY75]
MHNKGNTKDKGFRAALRLMLCIQVIGCTVQAQETAVVKTNLLYDATTSLSLGAELRLNGKLTLDLPVTYNPWTFTDGKKGKFLLFQPELRYWKDEPFRSFFSGLHIHGALFNTAKVIDGYRYQGWLAGAGFSAGYRWKLSGRWAIEANIGAGYAYIDYTKHTSGETGPSGCRTCGQKLESDQKHYWGPDRAGLSVSYTIGKTAKRPGAPETYPLPVAPHAISPAVPVAAVPADTVYIPCVDKQYRHESGSACILFPVDRYVVYPDYGNNRQELSKIQRSVETVLQLPGSRIESISLEAYASPEGELSHNISLSEKRAAALRDYMTAAYGFDAGCFSVRSKGENWDGLRAAVIAADALGDQEKTGILHILGEQDAPARKARLKAYRGGKPYAYLLGEVYPSLRVCEYRISFTVNSEQ